MFSEDNTFVSIRGAEATSGYTGTYVNNNGEIVLTISKALESDGCTESTSSNREIKYTLENGNLIGTDLCTVPTYTLKKVNLSDASIVLLEYSKLFNEKYHKTVCK